MEDAVYLYHHMAWWLCTNEPGTPVPEWCELSWSIREDRVRELIERYESEYGRKISEAPNGLDN